MQVRNRVTLKDVARRCGFSANTVSRAMRNDPKLSEVTRSKIQSIADEMGYIRNSLASTLRVGSGHMVAVIVNQVQNLHFSTLLSDMDMLLRNAGYNTMIMCMHIDETLATQMIRSALSHAVDGVLYFPYFKDKLNAELLAKNGTPFVLCDRWIDGVNADTVRCDDEQGGYLAGKHLTELGHRRITYIAGVDNNSSQLDRQHGVLRALSEADIAPDDVRILRWDETTEAISSGRLAELILPHDSTAIISFNDEVGYHILNMYRDNGVRVPEDVSIISFDHIMGGTPYLPKLTSIAEAGRRIAPEAVSLLLERMGDYDMPVSNRVLPVRIFDEGTTAPPPPASR